MKKLILSAFALSLMAFSGMLSAQTEAIDDFLGLETEILPELKGKQKFTGENLNQKESWNVTTDQVIKDLPEPNKGQGYSIIPWASQDPEEWLSITNWLLERKVKDQHPDWQIRLREANHTELMGKVLQCKGICYVYRGSNKARVQHLSRILEGDEFRTEKDSVAWVFTIDGSLVRLSPETSISFQEINLSVTEVFSLVRLNQGHVFWKPITASPEPMDPTPETDTYSLPLLVREANQEFFERTILKDQKPEERPGYVVELPYYAVEDQVTTINNLKDQNLKSKKHNSRLMLVSPNGSVIVRNDSFDFVHLTGGKSYFKKRSTEPEGFMNLHLRGYAATDVKPITELEWFEIESNGRSFAKMETVPGELQVLELLTKRIKTIELARQIWMKEFSLPIMALAENPQKLARDYGYKLWGEDIEKRVEFLIEYTRRIETTNLRSVENLLVKLEENGEKPRKELSLDLYTRSLNHYLLGLKSRYDKKNMRVREMNDLQYYVWILRNGKF